MVCRKLSNALTADVHLEIFHFKIDVIEEHLGKSADHVLSSFATGERADIREEIVQRPAEFLQTLVDAAGGADVVFKLFPGHLRLEPLREVIGMCSGMLLLERNLLHSFISQEIAIRNDVWGYHATDGHLVEFDIERFISHVQRVHDFYKSVKRLACEEGLTYRVENYEHLLDGGDRALLEKMTSIGARAKVSASGDELRRQDARQMGSDKVRNPDVLLSFLEQIGLQRANDVSEPLTAANFADAIAACSDLSDASAT